jgi:hypothetical protein
MRQTLAAFAFAFAFAHITVFFVCLPHLLFASGSHNLALSSSQGVLSALYVWCSCHVARWQVTSFKHNRVNSLTAMDADMRPTF